MQIALPNKSQEQFNFKGSKIKLSSLLRTQQLKYKYIRYSETSRRQNWLNPQTSFHKNEQKKFMTYRQKERQNSSNSVLNQFQKSYQLPPSSQRKELMSSSSMQLQQLKSRESQIQYKLKTRDKLNSKSNYFASFLKQKKKDSSDWIIQNNPSPKQQTERELPYFLSKNLPNKMNQYLNLLIHRSEQRYQQKLKKFQQNQQLNVAHISHQRRKFASQNCYYKKMKSSCLKRKKRIIEQTNKNPELVMETHGDILRDNPLKLKEQFFNKLKKDREHEVETITQKKKQRKVKSGDSDQNLMFEIREGWDVREDM